MQQQLSRGARIRGGLRAGVVALVALVSAIGCSGTQETTVAPKPSLTSQRPSEAVPSQSASSVAPSSAATSPSSTQPSSTPSSSAQQPSTQQPSTQQSSATPPSAPPVTATGLATVSNDRVNKAPDLPPPPAATTIPARTAGPLRVNSQPVPPQWQPVTAPDSEVSRGNGSPAIQRDPARAAYEAMLSGCARVDRRQWVDPTYALQISVERGGRPGVGVILQFATSQEALRYQQMYARTLQACGSAPTDSGAPGVEVVQASRGMLLDRRRYADGATWSEAVQHTGVQVRLWAVQQPLSNGELQQLASTVRG